MLVEKLGGKENFKPIRLQVTIETEAEMMFWESISHLDCTIPEWLISNARYSRDDAYDSFKMLKDFAKALR
jgi:hypothetical protein